MKQRWRIELLGQLRACRGSERTVPFQIQKSGALLAYLAYHVQHPQPRELLIEQLWPEDDPEEGRRKLRYLLYPLRQLLPSADSPGGSLLIAERTTLSLDPAAFTTDVAEFRAALQAEAAAEPGPRLEALSTAVGLYRGELLPGYYEPWVLNERQALAEQYLAALGHLVAAREAAGDLNGALSAARQAVSADPLREEAHYDVMRLAAALGQPSTALSQYQELERVLQEELGETPSAEARALAEELRRSGRTFVVARASGFGNPLPPAAPPAAAPAASPVPAPAAPAPPEVVPAELALPVQLTRFFGREEEIARLSELLSLRDAEYAPDAGTRMRDEGDMVSPHSCRLVTVTGPGGTGKTRLAIALAGRLRAAWEARVAFVPLADLTEAARIPDAIADALALSRSPEEPPLAPVIAHLRAAPWLLVLDNLEHLVEEGALLVRQLLEQVPSLVCLTTSRQRLGIAGEQEFALLPLPTPRGLGVRSWELGRTSRSSPNSQLLTPNSLMQYPSVQLFVDRAQAVKADFALTEGNAEAVAALCRKLEGMPLAIEMAAAWSKTLPPARIVERLEHQFDLLVSRRRDLPPRQQSLRAAIQWSYDLLSPELQACFARLSVFRGGWTLEAAEVVCGGELPLLAALQDQSLIVLEESGEEERYRMLEPLREYAGEQLAAAGELAATRNRHRDWSLRLAEQAEAAAYGPEQAVWLTRLGVELDNLRAALAWCQEGAGGTPAGALSDDAGGRSAIGPQATARPDRALAEAGLRLARALWWVWIRRGEFAEGLQWLEGALARSDGLPAAVRAPALFCAADLAEVQGNRGQGRGFLQAARHEYQEVLTLARAGANRREIVQTLQALAEIARRQQDWDAAWAFCAEARQRGKELDEPAMLARTLELMAGIPLARSDLQTARPLLEERLAICRALGDEELLIHALGGMGHVECREGHYERARVLYLESMVLRQKLGRHLPLAQSLEDLAALAGRLGEAARAIRLLGAAAAYCETLGARVPIADPTEYERTVAEGRAALGEAAFAATWAEGRAMSLDQAVEYALSP